EVLAGALACTVDVGRGSDPDRLVRVGKERLDDLTRVVAVELQASEADVGDERAHRVERHPRHDADDEDLRSVERTDDLAGSIDGDRSRGARDEVQADRARAGIHARVGIGDGRDATDLDVNSSHGEPLTEPAASRSSAGPRCRAARAPWR